MNKITLSIAMALILLGLCTSPVLAHSPMFTCFDDGNDNIQCAGEFSDGSSAAGSNVELQDIHGKVLQRGKLDRYGEFSFKRPQAEFRILFDGGPGHQVLLKGENIPKW